MNILIYKLFFNLEDEVDWGGGMKISGPLPRTFFSWSQVERKQKKFGLLVLYKYSLLRTESSAKKKCGVVQREWKGTEQVIFYIS